MIKVQYPSYDFKLKHEGEKHSVFCIIRKQWLVLTEEEWVRQNFVAYLITVLHYPATLIAVEKEILLNGLKKRFDILVYDRSHKPWMMIECKEAKVQLSENVLQQVLRYNMTVSVEYIVITNGSSTIAWKKNEGALVLLNELPGFG
jgi:hypothetical protein